MRRFLSKLAATWGNSTGGQGSRRRNCDFRPDLEALEAREVLSTLFLTSPRGPHDATHFSTFQAAYRAARPGDVIQVEPGAVVSDPSGTIHIWKQITLQGDPQYGRAPVGSAVKVGSWLHEVPGVVLQHLDFSNVSVYLGPLERATVRDSTLGNLTIGYNVPYYPPFSGGNVITSNTITGSLMIQWSDGDQVTNNTFHTNGDSTHAAIKVTDSTNETISGNQIHFNTPSALNNGLVIRANALGTNAVITGNTFDTGSAGTGLVISGSEGSALKVEGNDFNANQIGVRIYGDGSFAGSIDLGGGPLGSRGLNSFRSYTGYDGRLAIVLTNTDLEETVHARGNYWGLIDPHRVIEDFSHHGGTGIIDVETPPPYGTSGVYGGSYNGDVGSTGPLYPHRPYTMT
jgi:hypothetical protein